VLLLGGIEKKNRNQSVDWDESISEQDIFVNCKYALQ
jgi:hypothetical protein